MTVFLALIPRMKEPLRGEAPADFDALIRRIARCYQDTVGNTYDSEPTFSKPGSGNEARLMVWERQSDKASLEIKGNTWAVAAGTPVARQIVSEVHIRAGAYVYDHPVWGTYATILGQRYANRLVAWNTTPALEAIHFGTNDDFIAISNRPFPIALALADTKLSQVKLSENYLDEYLLYGFNVTSQSPFTGVNVLDPTQSVIVSNGELSFGPLPTGLESELTYTHNFDEGVEALVDALRGSSSRSVRSVPSGRVQLRMSGGKDSRLLLGLLKDEPVSSYAVTFGKPEDSETKAGYYLCREAGIDLRLTAPQIVEETTLHKKVARTILMSDGIPASEPHTSIYEGSTPAANGDGIMLGQWPLFKGGMAKKLRYSPGGIEQVLHKQGSWIVSEEARSPYDQFIKNWKSKRTVYNELEFLYLFAREFRSGRWLQAHISLYERDATIAYPLADSQVTAVSDTLSMFEKISQRTLFGALEKIWPLATATPLSNSGVWRFEVGGPDEHLGRDTYNNRHAPLNVTVPSANSMSFRSAYEYTTNAATDLATGVLASPRFSVLRKRLDPLFVRHLKQTAEGKFSYPEVSSRREFIKLLWRVYVADVWLSRSWLEPASNRSSA